MTKLAANLTMLFTEVDFLDRFDAAARAGFKGVEFLFPYDFPKDALKERLDSNGLTQALFNLPAGDWAGGDRGVAVDPNRVGEFQDGVGLAIEYADALDCKLVNCLAGLAPEGVADEKLREAFVSNLKFAAPKLAGAGITLIVEAINTRDIPGFWLNYSAQSRSILEEVGAPNMGFQYDIYHMQIMEGDLAPTIEKNLDIIRHFQVADNPGRHEPGSGEINYGFLLPLIDMLGYEGWVGCEYNPAGRTEDGLGWTAPYLRG